MAIILDQLGGCRSNNSAVDKVAYFSDEHTFLKHILDVMNIPIIRRNIIGSDVAQFSSAADLMYSNTDVPIFGSWSQRREFMRFLDKVAIKRTLIKLFSTQLLN